MTGYLESQVDLVLGLRFWVGGYLEGQVDLRAFGLLGLKESKGHGSYYKGLYRDYYKDPFLHS